MKIRHKQSGVVLEGAFDERAYWVGSIRHEYFGLVPASSTYDKKEWEEVKPVWKDVTAECVAQPSGFYHQDGSDTWSVQDRSNIYRFRKVKLFAGYCSTEQQDAFIIEQRQA